MCYIDTYFLLTFILELLPRQVSCVHYILLSHERMYIARAVLDTVDPNGADGTVTKACNLAAAACTGARSYAIFVDTHSHIIAQMHYALRHNGHATAEKDRRVF